MMTLSVLISISFIVNILFAAMGLTLSYFVYYLYRSSHRREYEKKNQAQKKLNALEQIDSIIKKFRVLKESDKEVYIFIMHLYILATHKHISDSNYSKLEELNDSLDKLFTQGHHIDYEGVKLKIHEIFIKEYGDYKCGDCDDPFPFDKLIDKLLILINKGANE